MNYINKLPHDHAKRNLSSILTTQTTQRLFSIKKELPTRKLSETHYELRQVIGGLKWKSGYDWQVDPNHQLKPLLKELPKGFFHQGTFQDENDDYDGIQNVELMLSSSDNVGEVEKKISCGTLMNPNITQLLNAAKGSSFGKGTETVYDENVRKGKEITAKQLTFVKKVKPKTDSDEAAANYDDDFSFEELIKETLIMKHLPADFLGENNGTEVRFYKMAIYEPGGHFQVHRDTVHAASHKATLLIEVRSDHEGGELKFEKNGEEFVWNLTNKSDSTEAPLKEFIPKSTSLKKSKKEGSNNDIRWCIFYTDIQHQVEPIRAGVRIVLQFDIYSSENPLVEDVEKTKDKVGDAISGNSTPLDSNDVFYSKTDILQKIIAIVHKQVNTKQVLALPLFYLYTSQSIFPEYLKNIDKEVFNTLVEAGFTIALIPVALTTESNDDGEYNKDGSVTISTKDLPTKVYCKKKGKMIERVLNNWPYDLKLIYVLSGMEPIKKVSEKDYAEYTGNELAPGERTYLSGALFIFPSN